MPPLLKMWKKRMQAAEREKKSYYINKDNHIKIYQLYKRGSFSRLVAFRSVASYICIHKCCFNILFRANVTCN